MTEPAKSLGANTMKRVKDMVAEARKIAKNSPKITVKALDEKSMEKLGMGSLLSVSRGSSEPAYSNTITYLVTPYGCLGQFAVGAGIPSAGWNWNSPLNLIL